MAYYLVNLSFTYKQDVYLTLEQEYNTNKIYRNYKILTPKTNKNENLTRRTTTSRTNGKSK